MRESSVAGAQPASARCAGRRAPADRARLVSVIVVRAILASPSGNAGSSAGRYRSRSPRGSRARAARKRRRLRTCRRWRPRARQTSQCRADRLPPPRRRANRGGPTSDGGSTDRSPGAQGPRGEPRSAGTPPRAGPARAAIRACRANRRQAPRRARRTHDGRRLPVRELHRTLVRLVLRGHPRKLAIRGFRDFGAVRVFVHRRTGPASKVFVCSVSGGGSDERYPARFVSRYHPRIAEQMRVDQTSADPFLGLSRTASAAACRQQPASTRGVGDSRRVG